MLLHVISLLVHLANRAGKQAAPVEKHRNLPADPLVVHCPRCGTLGLCEHFELQEALDGPRGHPWRTVNEIFVCGGCRLVLAAEHFENDGTGVLRAKQWTCPECQSLNPETQMTCSHCRQWRK